MPYPLINGAAINADADTGGTTTAGFMHTRYGRPVLTHVAGPARVISPASLGAITQIGTPVVAGVKRTMHVDSIIRTARFGIPTAVSRVVQPGGIGVGVATLSVTTRFGTAKLAGALQVVAASVAPTFAAGTPAVRPRVLVQGFQSTAFGEPRAARVVRSTSFQSTVFGEPRAARRASVPSLPGLRYGTPRISGSTPSTAQGFCSTELGTHSVHPMIHALPAAPGTRFGRATIVRNSQC